MDLSEILNQSPNFQSWVQQKKLNTTDLDILTEFQNFKTIEPILIWIAQHQPSHSQGCQILELGSELLLMNKPIDPTLNKSQHAKNLIEELKKLRYPLSSSSDEQKQQILKELVKSQSIKTHWARYQDKGYLEVSFKSYSSKDLEQKIQGLKQIQKSLEDKFWNK